MATGIFSNRYSAEDHSSCLILLSTVGGQRLDIFLLIIVHIYISSMLFKFSCSLLSPMSRNKLPVDSALNTILQVCVY